MAEVIGVEEFRREVLTEKRPVLLACLNRHSYLRKQLEVVANVSEQFGSGLKVCILDEEFLSALSLKYSILGTPTFLLFHEGKERDRFLGLAEHSALNDFVQSNLNKISTINHVH